MDFKDSIEGDEARWREPGEGDVPNQ